MQLHSLLEECKPLTYPVSSSCICKWWRWKCVELQGSQLPCIWSCRLFHIESSQDKRRFCPFTGRGDFLIQRKNATSAAVIHEPTPEDDHWKSTSLNDYNESLWSVCFKISFKWLIKCRNTRKSTHLPYWQTCKVLCPWALFARQ